MLTCGIAARPACERLGTRSRHAVTLATAVLLPLAWGSGCTGISIAPSCPNQLTVGASGVVAANVINPGQVPTYSWVAIPANAGTFEDAALPITRFTASQPGEVTIQLTASDGLFQVQSFCRITVVGETPPPTGSGVVVALSSNPADPVTNQPVTITCRSTGDPPATSFTFSQVAGNDVAFTLLGGSSILFTPTAAGTATFQCIGRADDGSEGNPATLELTIIEPPGGGRPPR